MTSVITKRAMGLAAVTTAFKSQCDYVDTVIQFFINHFKSKKINRCKESYSLFLPEGLRGGKVGTFPSIYEEYYQKNTDKVIEEIEKTIQSGQTLVIFVYILFPKGGGGAEEDKTGRETYSAHSNMLLVDGAAKTLIHFEPHGLTYKAIQTHMDGLSKSLGLTFRSFSMKRSGQGIMPLCATFSLFNIVVICVNPDFPDSLFLAVAARSHNIIMFLAYISIHVPALFDCHVRNIKKCMERGSTFKIFAESLTHSEDLEEAAKYMQRYLPEEDYMKLLRPEEFS